MRRVKIKLKYGDAFTELCENGHTIIADERVIRGLTRQLNAAGFGDRLDLARFPKHHRTVLAFERPAKIRRRRGTVYWLDF